MSSPLLIRKLKLHPRETVNVNEPILAKNGEIPWNNCNIGYDSIPKTSPIKTGEHGIPPHLTIFRSHSINISDHTFSSSIHHSNPELDFQLKRLQYEHDLLHIMLNHSMQRNVDKLRLEELHILKQLEQLRADILKPPMKYWYELKDKRFHQEYHKNRKKVNIRKVMEIMRSDLTLSELEKVIEFYEIWTKY